MDENHTQISGDNPVGFTYSGSKTGSKVFTINNLKVTLLDWGSYFDNMSPCTYYNRLYNDSAYKNEKHLGITDAAEDIDIVYSEMNDMKTAMQPKEATNIYVMATLA